MLTHDRRILLIACAAGLPGVLVSLIVLWGGDYTAKVQWTLSVLIVGVWVGLAFSLLARVIDPLQTVSNLLAALREDDFSIRARVEADDALGNVMMEVNALSETLRRQRLGAQEATALLRAVMAEIDVAIFAFDSAQRLVLVNRSGERLLGRSAARLRPWTGATTCAAVSRSSRRARTPSVSRRPTRGSRACPRPTCGPSSSRRSRSASRSSRRAFRWQSPTDRRSPCRPIPINS